MNKSKVSLKQGFTLIELIIVIAILAFVTVVGIHNYGNMKDVQAKKMNVTNIKRVFHALATYNEVREDVYGRFNNLDSLIDAPSSGWQQKGTAGTYNWNVAKGDTACILYDGAWKTLTGVQAIEESQNKNHGLTSDLVSKIALYYLTDTDVASMKEAGISRYLYHNWWQLTPKNTPGENDVAYTHGGGGPSFRADMSAYLSCPITNGSAVVMIRPDAKCESVAGYIYDHLGYTWTNYHASAGVTTSEMEKILSSKPKLIVMGIGRGAECVTSQLGLGEAPYDPVYNKTYYRQYLAVFALYTGSRGTTSTCRLVGVLDPRGNTWEAASYGLKWQTTEN